MAQELEYRVKLDVADLSAQLQQVRSQIDQAMGAMAFQTTTPTAFASSFAFPFNQTFGAASAMAAGDIANTSAGMRQGFVDTEAFLQSTRLGFQKFNNDVQTAYLSQVAQPMFVNANGATIPDIQSRGVFANTMTSIFGFGYDPRMSVSPGVFRRAAGYDVAASSFNVAGNLGFGFAGAAVGTYFGGPIGGLIGGTLGGMVGDLTYDAMATTVLRDYDMASRVRDFAFNTSWRSLGGRLSRADALRVGEQASTLARSPNLVGYEVSTSDVGRLTQEYTAMGGFDYVRSAEDYSRTLKNVVENHRKVMHTLRVSEEDALRVIRDLSMYGMGNNLGGATSYIAATAYGAGYSSKEMLNFAQQAGEMMRGTGMSIAAGAMYGMDALARVKAGMSQGQISPLNVGQFGGVENYTLNMQRAGLDWATSTSGFTQLAAAASLGGLSKTMGLNPVETISAAVGHLVQGGIPGMLAFQGGQAARIAANSPMVYNAMSGLQLAEEMNMSGIRGADINQRSFIGYAQMRYGWSQVQAQQTWATMNMGDNYDVNKVRYNMTRQALDETPTYGSILTDKIGNAFSEGLANLGRPLAAVGRAIESSVENFMVEEDRRRLASVGYQSVSMRSLGVSTVIDKTQQSAEIRTRQDKYNALNSLLKTPESGRTRSTAVLENETGITGIAAFIDDIKKKAADVQAGPNAELAAVKRAEILRDALQNNPEMLRRITEQKLMSEVTQMAIGTGVMTRTRDNLGTDLRSRFMAINKEISNVQKSFLAHTAKSAGMDADNILYGEYQQLKDKEGNIASEIRGGGLLSGLSGEALEEGKAKVMEYLTTGRGLTEEQVKKGGKALQQWRESVASAMVKGDTRVKEDIASLRSLGNERGVTEKELAFQTRVDKQMAIGDKAMMVIGGGINQSILGWTGLGELFTGAVQDKREALEKSLRSQEQLLENTSTTSMQLGKIAARLKGMGANTSVMNDPALAMQQMQGEAMAVGLEQIRAILQGLYDLASDSGKGLKVQD